MTTRTAVSIVIPHYGAPEPTLELVEMLRPQVRGDDQIIVVDDASPAPFPAMTAGRVVRRSTNGGFGAAVNSGAEVAEAAYLLVLNSDLRVGPDFVSALLAAAAPWLPAVVSPRVVDADGSDAWTGRHFPRVRHQVVEWLVPLARFRDRPRLHEWVGHDTSVGAGTSAVDWVVGAAMLVPTAEFRAVGGFDERFYMNSEEVDLQRRLRDRGVPSVVLDAPTVVHDGGGSSDPARRRAWLVRSRLVYADKWGSRRVLQASLVVASLVNLAWNVGRRLLGRPVSPVRTAREELALITQATDR